MRVELSETVGLRSLRRMAAKATITITRPAMTRPITKPRRNFFTLLFYLPPEIPASAGGFTEQMLKQVVNAQAGRPGMQIFEIELCPADFHNSSKVVPLLLRGLTTGAIPAELIENGVLGRSDGTFDRLVAKRPRLFELPATELCLIVVVGEQREDIELERAGVVDEIERPAPP